VDVLEINQDVTSVLAFKFEVVQQYYATLFKIGGGGDGLYLENPQAQKTKSIIMSF